MKTHFFNMVLYALVTATLLSVIMREGVRDRYRFVLKVTGILVASAVGAAWIMYLAP